MSERITIEQALDRGYHWGPIGYNHAAGRTIIAALTTIRRLSFGGLYDVAALERIREDQAEPESPGDIPMEFCPARGANASFWTEGKEGKNENRSN